MADTAIWMWMRRVVRWRMVRLVKLWLLMDTASVPYASMATARLENMTAYREPSAPATALRASVRASYTTHITACPTSSATSTTRLARRGTARYHATVCVDWW